MSATSVPPSLQTKATTRGKTRVHADAELLRSLALVVLPGYTHMSGFLELLGAGDSALACSPEALTPCSLAERLEGKKYAAIYFSANWCGPCRRFTPLLAEWYAKVSDDVEIIFASCCDDAAAFEEYAKAKHPWLALPYEVSQGGVGYVRSKVREEEGKENGKMAVLCGVKSVPHLAVFEVQSGKLLTANGRLDISGKDNGPDGALPTACYTDPAAVLAKWVAQQHAWRPADAACTGAVVVEADIIEQWKQGKPTLLTENGGIVEAAKSSSLFVLLVASADPQTGRSWCPDCVSVRDMLTAKFGALPPEAAVIEAPVTRAEWAGNAAHPYRQQPFGATGVPCLLRLGPGGVESKLTEGELLDEAALDALFGLGVDEGVAAGSNDVVLGGLPDNPPAALVYQIKQKLGLVTTPTILSLGAGSGRALLSVYNDGDLEKLKAAAAEGFSIFGAGPVATATAA